MRPSVHEVDCVGSWLRGRVTRLIRVCVYLLESQWLLPPYKTIMCHQNLFIGRRCIELVGWNGVKVEEREWDGNVAGNAAAGLFVRRGVKVREESNNMAANCEFLQSTCTFYILLLHLYNPNQKSWKNQKIYVIKIIRSNFNVVRQFPDHELHI